MLLKVLALDRVYDTRIFEIHLEPLARHVADLKIDRLLERSSLRAVDRIFVCPGVSRKYYSFATKFCSWHKPEVCHIYDHIGWATV